MIIPWKRVKLSGRVMSGFAFTPDKRFTLSTHFQKTPIEARIQYSQNEMRLIIVLVLELSNYCATPGQVLAKQRRQTRNRAV